MTTENANTSESKVTGSVWVAVLNHPDRDILGVFSSEEMALKTLYEIERRPASSFHLNCHEIDNPW